MRETEEEMGGRNASLKSIKHMDSAVVWEGSPGADLYWSF